ncbi:MAG: hypothetical protein QM795_13985 [Pseudoxanthomonas sp.]
MSTRILIAGLLMLTGCESQDVTPPAAPSNTPRVELPAVAGPSSSTQVGDQPLSTSVNKDDASEMDKAIDDALGDHAAYRKLLEDLQVAVKNNDKAGVAALVDFPLEVTVAGKKTRVRNASEFAANYDGIMADEIKKAITEQRYEELTVNWQGVMIGNGQVWLNGICVDKACKQSSPRVVTLQLGPK